MTFSMLAMIRATVSATSSLRVHCGPCGKFAPGRLRVGRARLPPSRGRRLAGSLALRRLSLVLVQFDVETRSSLMSSMILLFLKAEPVLEGVGPLRTGVELANGDDVLAGGQAVVNLELAFPIDHAVDALDVGLARIGGASAFGRGIENELIMPTIGWSSEAARRW